MKIRCHADEPEELQNNNVEVKIADEAHNQCTTDLMILISTLDNNPINWAEVECEQIDQMGMEHYLVKQIKQALK